MKAPCITPSPCDFDLLKEAIDSNICGMTISDTRLPDMPLIFINKGFERITGYKKDEVIGRNCRFLQGDYLDQPGVEVLKRAMRDHKPCTVLLKNAKKSGEPFWNELILSPIFDESGELTHFVGIQNDVTEREEMRLELIRREQDLQMVIKKLKHLMEDKTRLLSVVAHDLRSPLSNIIGLNELVVDQLGKGEASEFAAIALAEARNAYNMLNNTLNQQSIESGKLFIDKRPTHLAAFSASVSRELGAKAAHKDMKLSVHTYFEVEEFEMDALKVKQILQNLVGNAIKFSTRGSEIDLEMRASASRISFTVCDHGQGIKAEELDKIFTTFEHATTKSTEGEEGFGMGLSIVKEIVELHGGEISVESKVGEGSCFKVMLW